MMRSAAAGGKARMPLGGTGRARLFEEATGNGDN